MKKYKLLLIIAIIAMFKCAWIFHWSLIDLNVNITTVNTIDKDVLVKEETFSGKLYPYFIEPSESVTKTLAFESNGYKQGIDLERANITLLILTTDSSGAFTELLMKKTVAPEFPFDIPWDYDDDLNYNDTIIIQ